MGEAAEGSKTLHNWMGEPRPGDQDDEDKTLQLSLGLPGGGGGGGWTTPGREKGNHSVAGSSMLSLGYSNAAPFSPCSQGMQQDLDNHLWEHSATLHFALPIPITSIQLQMFLPAKKKNSKCSCPLSGCIAMTRW